MHGLPSVIIDEEAQDFYNTIKDVNISRGDSEVQLRVCIMPVKTILCQEVKKRLRKSLTFRIKGYDYRN